MTRPGPVCTPWWFAHRAMAFCAATGVALAMRGTHPGHRSFVPVELVVQLMQASGVLTLALVLVAAVADLRGSRRADCRSGTRALALVSGAALTFALATWLAGSSEGRALLGWYRTEMLVQGLTSAGKLLGAAGGAFGLVGLGRDSSRRRAAASVLVVASVALFWMTVPMFQRGCCESPITKAREDLDTLRSAITLHDAQQGRLGGTSFQPLLGRYLQELPRDRWGRDYLLDTRMGLMMSFGADGKPGGSQDEDMDIVVRYLPGLRVQHAACEGPTSSWLRIRLLFTKCYRLEGDPTSDLVLILDPRTGRTLPLANAGWTFDPVASDPEHGVLVISGPIPPSARFDPKTCAIDIRRDLLEDGPDGPRSRSKIREGIVAGGPCDIQVHGTGTVLPDGAHPIELIGGQARGVPLVTAVPVGAVVVPASR